MAEATHGRIMGLWFEEFEIGKVTVTPGRTVTEADVVMFSALTGDYSQVHTDVEYCKQTVFGDRVAHGLLGLALIPGLMVRSVYTQGSGVASLGWNNWQFKRPIFIGDTVRVRWQARSKRDSRSRPDVGIITEYIELLNQRDEVVQDGEHLTMVRKRPS